MTFMSAPLAFNNVEYECRLLRPQDSRHTYATLLKANGNDPKVVQGLLRHANFHTTMNLYTQAVPEQQRRAHDELLTQLVTTAPDARNGGDGKFCSRSVRAGVLADDARPLKRLGVPDGI